MTLKELQQNVDQWIKSHGGYWDEFQIMARMTEELGEIASALQRMRGLRGRKEDINIASEVADLLFVLSSFSNVMNIDLDVEIEKVFEKYNKRSTSS